MPTIKVRKQTNGSTRYTALVRLRRGTTVLHQERRTVTHRTAALSWAKYRMRRARSKLENQHMHKT